jgi:hypothetical protein
MFSKKHPSLRATFIIYYLVCMLPLAQLLPRVAQAEFIPTEYAILKTESNLNKEEIKRFFSKTEVIAELNKYGVSETEAKLRVDSLSDQELRNLAKNIDNIPAGGDGVGVVLGAVVLIFIVLLVTDILGLTKVFPFTRSVR